MSFLQINSLTKIYEDGEGKKAAINNINLSFPSSGLITITGPSGCGKSTLLNCISLIDKPTSGDVYLDGKNITKISKKKVSEFYNQNVGFIFQNYNLIDDQTSLYNVMLPMLISGASFEESKKDATTLFKSIDFDQKLYDKNVKDLSGGEKQRVSICRAVINGPSIVIADEPTGALDYENSLKVMDLLRNLSKSRLVLLVSHNKELVDKYADRIIEMKDGVVIKDNVKKSVNNGKHIINYKKRKKGFDWKKFLIKSHGAKRKGKNLGSLVSLCIGLTSLILTFGFSFGAKKSVENKKSFHLDYGVAKIEKEIVSEKLESGLSIVKTIRPNYEELIEEKSLENFIVEPNYDTLLFTDFSIKYLNKDLDNISYVPVFSFSDTFIDKTLLLKGSISEDSLSECLINKEAFNKLQKIGFKIGESLNIDCTYRFRYVSKDFETLDTFIYKKDLRITGVVDELSFLSTPKIYYSHIAFDDYLSNTLLNNLSSKIYRDYSWKEAVVSSDSNNEISSYSYRLFANNNSIKLDSIVFDNNQLKITSNAVSINDALIQLIDACTIGIEIFLLIALIGVVLIIGIISFSSYSEDRKESAILTALGATKDVIVDVYANEALYTGVKGYVISVVLSFIFSFIINRIILITTGFNYMVNIPWLSLMGKPLIFPLIILIGIILVSLLSTIVPILLSKQISIKKELLIE